MIFPYILTTFGPVNSYCFTILLFTALEVTLLKQTGGLGGNASF
jgi:hypothetical protein